MIDRLDSLTEWLDKNSRDPLVWWLLSALLAWELLMLVILALAGAAQAVPMVVTETHDADTFWVQPQDGPAFKVRLWGADAPELAVRGRWAALRAGQALRGRPVSIIRKGKSYDWVVTRVIMTDGADYAEWRIAQGYARWDARFAPQAANLRQAEERTRANGWAIHRASDQAPPWDWRRGLNRELVFNLKPNQNPANLSSSCMRSGKNELWGEGNLRRANLGIVFDRF